MPPRFPVSDAAIDLLLEGDGQVAAMIRQKDWSAHLLGPPEHWPGALRVALGLVLNSPESMLLAWGPELHLFFNDTYAPLLGPRIERAVGGRLDEVWADAWAQAEPIIADAFAGRSTRFEDLPWKLDTDRGPADTWWTFSYSRVLDEAGAVAGLFIFTNETTSRVLGDAALRQSRQDLATALDEVRALNEELERRVAERTAERDRMWDLSPDLLAVLDPDGRLRRVNPAWTVLLGHAAEDVVGHLPVALVHPDDVAATQDAIVRAKTEPLLRFENRVRHKDGSYRWFSWVAAPGASEIFATGRHVTEAKQAEEALARAQEQLRQAQKVEAVGQLTGGVAHDFNNLLTVIRGSVDLLRRPGLSDERRARYTDAIADTTDRAARLTSQLLAFARRQALKPQTFDVGESLRAILAMVRTLGGNRLQVTLALPEQPCWVYADRDQFDTAVVNMAVNARDAMESDGTLSIVVGTADQIPATRSHAVVPGQFVTVSLSDTGGGIPPERIDRIFEPFFTTKGVGGGSGLGLSQVFGFAKQSGGEIVVASAANEGTTFTLYLPRAEAAATRGDDHAVERGPALGRGACVLVVEDNAEVGAFATQALAELGYDTVLAADANQALGELDQDGDRFDMVFSDVVMPGMSGVELAREIRRRRPELAVMLTSGYSAALAKSGTEGFELLRKPYSMEELARALASVSRHRP